MDVRSQLKNAQIEQRATSPTKQSEIVYNTVSNEVEYYDNAGAKAVVTKTGTQTLTNKTLTSPVLNSQATGTAILDEDNMVSDSANHLATQQSIKAYADTKIAKSAYTAKGDLLAATGAATPAALTVGTNGQVLTADSAEASGVKWSSLGFTSPMTTGGDLIYGGASGVAARLANGTNGQYLKSTGSTNPPAWQSFTAPTVQRFTSGSGTYTPAANVLYIIVEMVGGGGGGGGGGTAGGTAGNSGNNTTFRDWTAGGGSAGGARTGGGGGGGGTTTGTGTVLVAVDGGAGGNPCGTSSANIFGTGGHGGVSFYGGAGSGNVGAAAGASAGASTGSGGGGGGSNNGASAFGGTAGGAGAYLKFQINSPSAYSYGVGSGGTAGSAGTSGGNGGAGGSGVIVVTEYYQ